MADLLIVFSVVIAIGISIAIIKLSSKYSKSREERYEDSVIERLNKEEEEKEKERKKENLE